ncbi:hypothetical protein TSOC_013172 [Tetrabaena socialis]|uniref:F-box domain-containing protein n=1 Tax=Tetrabaena socialis TaxID=47790 RepID=A0A2J7ZL20_9CHLO|nr:hypothetical protein TSOC_013172 [Tetrabaena socialis]|eukprot:PNH00968.1 hypothetical protein TSOC_013172 [Tetrabaena socialis]
MPAEAPPDPGQAPDLAGLLNVLPLLWSLLGVPDRRALRTCCRATRRTADQQLDALSACHSGLPRTDWRLHLAARAIRGALERGARPRRLELRLQLTRSSAFDKFRRLVLSRLGAMAPPALTDVRLHRVPLTSEVVQGLTAAAPRLTVLRLSGYELPCCGCMPCTWAAHEALASVRALLRHAAPQLEELELGLTGGLAAEPWLPAALQQCSRLARLSLGEVPGEAALGALGALPRLRALALRGVTGRDRLSGLAGLTALTALSLDAAPEAALPAVAALHGLARLELAGCALRPEGLLLLAGLPQLRHLHVETVALPRQQATPADGGGGGAAAAAAAAEAAEATDEPEPLPLPPRLEVLELGGPIHPGALAALRPAGPLELLLWPRCVLLEREADQDPYGRLQPAAAEALLGACGQLAGRTRAACLSLSWPKAPYSWGPARYGVLFAALAPAALVVLELRSVVLWGADVAALAQHLPTLQVLHLICHAPLPAWPLLRRLPRLRELRLHPGMGNMADIWEEFGDEQGCPVRLWLWPLALMG